MSPEPIKVTRSQAARLERNLQGKGTRKNRQVKTTQSFLCGPCRQAMCTDCRQIAEEYQKLLEARTQALSNAQYQLEQTKIELEKEKRRADAFEKIAKIGLPQTILAWMDDEMEQILQAKET